MIGILYYIKSNEYLYYHPINGFSVIENIERIDKNVIWISNFKEINLPNIKKEDFFNIKFKEIIYFYNINHLKADKQFEVILKFFNSIIDIFKEEYSFFNMKVEHLIKLDNFSEIFFKSKIELPVNKELYFIKNNFNKEVEFKDIKQNKFFISYFQNYEFIKSIFDINIPCGDYEIINAEKYSKHKDPFIIMDSMQREKCFLMECAFDDEILLNDFFPEKGNCGWFTDFELKWLKGKCKLEVKKIMIFEDKFRLKELMRTRFKTKYFNFPFEIFTINLLKSIQKNNIHAVNIWLEAYEKIFFLDKSLNLILNNIEIGYLIGNKVVIGLDDIHQIETLEDNGLMYPVKLVSYIINN